MLCELPLYIALLTHRFVISTRKVKVVTWLCMLWSVALRVLEAVILIAYFAGTYDRMKRWPFFSAVAFSDVHPRLRSRALVTHCCNDCLC